MKKAINIWSFQGKTLREAMGTAARAGFQGIELAMDGSGELTPQTSSAELKDIRKAAEEAGIEIHSLASGLYWDYPFTSDDAEERRKALELAGIQIRMAKELGAGAVLIVPGAVGVDFLPERPAVSYDAAYERALEAFLKIRETAGEYEIQVGVENVWNKFLLSPLEMRNFIDEIGSPFVGAYLDVGNVLYCGYPEQWIEILGSRIKRVHFKDYRRAAGGLHGFVDLLAGDVDWKGVMEAFEAAGYDGWCSAEMIPAYAQYSDQIIFNTSLSMDRIFRKE